MKAFVTGGSGFLGQVLVEHLTKKGWSVDAPSSKDCNLFFSDDLNKFTDTYDNIFHLAAWTQAGDFCLKYPGDQWVNNQQINTHVLSWWIEKQQQAKLTFIGTSCVYDPEMDLVEENFLSGEPVESLFTYAHTKRMLLIGAMAAQKQYGVNWNCFVPSTLYGPNYHEDGRQLHFIFDLCRKIIRGKYLGETVTLWGDGSQVRELIHVTDFVELMLKNINIIENSVLNIGFGKGYRILDFAELICQNVGFNKDLIEYDVSKYVGAKSKVLNTSRLQKIDTTELKSLNDGIAELVAWFIDTGFWKDK